MTEAVTKRVRVGVPARRQIPVIRRRHDVLGPILWLAAADEYVMLRRPGAFPFTMLESDWELLGETAEDAQRLQLVVQWGAVEPCYARRSTDPKPFLTEMANRPVTSAPRAAQDEAV